MSKWETVKLGDVCTKVTDGSHNPPQGIAISEYLMLSSKNIYNDNITLSEPRYISKTQYENENKRTEIQSGDILMTIVGTIGRVAVVPDNFLSITLQRSVAVLRPKKEITDSRFLMFCLRSKQRFLEKEAHGVAQKGIYLKQIKEIEISLPPIEIQREIAKTLDTTSELISLRKKQLVELDNLVKSTFYEMFGDPVTNERGWEVVCIKDFAKVETGSTPNRSIDSYYNAGEIPWVKTGEINGGYIFSAEEFITQQALDETNCKVMPENTILVAMYGQGKTRGKVGLLMLEATTNQACAAILPNSTFSTEYLLRILDICYNELRNLGRGGNQPNLNLSIIKNFEIIFPPLTLQNQFAQIVTKIEEQKALVQKAIDESQYLFDSLMSQYFE